MMYLAGDETAPASCPMGWGQINYQVVEASSSSWNFVRTCVINSPHAVIYLAGSGTPAACPGGWSQADLQNVAVADSYNSVRTCFQ